LSLTGEVGWARLSTGADPTHVVGATPVALFLRAHLPAWLALKDASPSSAERAGDRAADADASRVLDVLRTHGASFPAELASATQLAEAAVRIALADLVAAGLVSSDGFGGLRAIVRASAGAPIAAGRGGATGRWSIVRAGVVGDKEAAIETQARVLLRRYGVVFRRLLTRETTAAPWRDLARALRRLEARGEIRGGRFVAGMSGEQFALPDAVERLRETRRTPPNGRLHLVCGADPLNLVGIVTAGERVRAVAATRIVYSDGMPIAAMEGDYVRPLIQTNVTPAVASDVATLLAGRPMPPVLSGFVGR
jgi:ATP-dependent Lhr-like helicase